MIVFCLFSAIQQQTPQGNTTGTGTVAAGQPRPRAPTTPAGSAPSQEGLFCLVCVVLIHVAARFGLWTMMAELCFSVDDFILDVFSNTAADTAREYVSYGHRRCWAAAASCPYYSCPHRAKPPVRLVLPRVCCSRIRAKTGLI